MMLLTEVPEKALTWKAHIAFLFSTLVLQPILIYYNLVSGMVLPIASWIPMVLWPQLAYYLRSKITRKELFLISTFQPIALIYSTYFLTFVRNMYYSQSEAVIALKLLQDIPDWWVPKGDALMDILHSKLLFLNRAWLVPIGMSILVLLLGVIAEMVIGYLSYQVFARVERLDFPSARAQVATIETLVERRPDFIRVLFLSALVGVIVHLVTKFIPFAIGPFLYGGTLAYSYAAPFFDFTPYLDQILPGAAFIVPLDPLFYVPGFVLPPSISLLQFVGAFSLYVVGSHLITRFALWPQESLWATGWGYWTLQYRSMLYFFVSLIIGLSIAAMIFPLVLNPKPLKRGIRSLMKSMEVSESIFSPNLLLLLYLGSTLGISLVFLVLTGFSFPIWVILLLVVGGSFFANYIATASAGLTFQGVNIPYLRELSIFYSGYQKRDAYFVPLPLSVSGTIGTIGPASTIAAVPLGGVSIAQGFLQADLLGVRHSEYVKAYVILLALSLSSSFIFTSFFWYTSPIPSSAYPATIVSWPVEALSWARMQVWVSSGYLFKQKWIFAGLGIGGAIVLVTYFLRIPYVLLILITGSLMGIPMAFGQLIASIISNRFLKSWVGADRWNRYRYLLVMGYLFGDGLMEVFRGLMILIVRSEWILPF